MLARTETRYIVITATMDDPRPLLSEIEWRGRKYGYFDAGPHFVIEDRRVGPNRPLHLRCVGVLPFNDVSVLITLAGKPPFTPQQMADLGATVLWVLNHYPDAQVIAHSDLPGSRSNAPGFDVAAWWVGLRAQMALGQ